MVRKGLTYEQKKKYFWQMDEWKESEQISEGREDEKSKKMNK